MEDRRPPAHRGLPTHTIETRSPPETPHRALATVLKRDGGKGDGTPIQWVALAIPLTVAVLVALLWGSLVLQHGAAAYVGAESQWAKGQKSAVIELYRTVAQDVPPNLADFERALAVPAAYQRARVELEAPHPDYAVATRALIDGGSHPRDAPTMARLYPLFKTLPVVQQAVTFWMRGDVELDSLRMSARALVTARGNRAATAAVLARVREHDERLTQLELGFSGALGEATRTLAIILGFTTIILGAALAGIGMGLFRRATRDAAIAARANQRRLEEFRALAEDAPDAIARLDLEGRHVFANAMLARTFDLPASEFMGRTHAELGELAGTPPEFARRWRAGIADVLATRHPIAFDVMLHSRAGAREFSIRLAPQLTSTGAMESLIAVARDVTELRASARALRERDEQLQHAQKIEAVGQLAGGIAHDFNNILTAIIGYLELALEELPADSPARHDVEAAILSSRRATSLTRQLLTFGRRQFVETARVDLNAIVSETQDMLSRLVGTRVHIETHYPRESIPVSADATQLQQVLVNLVVNARDAMPDGGTIDIETSASTDETGAHAMLTVSDSGQGMSAETCARVFEPFFTTKPRGEGTGLGLSIVHGIVVQSGGAIELESTPGLGTRVRIRLPLMAARAPTPTGTAAVPAAEAADPVRVRILLVEDETPVRNAARRTLERAGHFVTEAQHAEDALMLWRRDSNCFDAVVTDLMMPGMDGWTLLRTLRAGRPSLPAVVMSGYTGTLDVSDHPNHGAPTLTLAKPFGVRELTDCVRRLMELAAST